MTHPSPEQLAAFLERRLDSAEREGLMHHLAICSACRHELRESARLVRTNSAIPRRSRVTRLAAFASVAAALALMVRVTSRPEGDGTQGRAQRLAQPDVVAPLEIVAPAEGDSVAGAEVRLVWRSAGRDVSYEVTLQDEVGRVLRTWSTSDSAVTVSSDVVLQGGRDYYWSVDAQRPDGSSTRSRAHRFVR